MILIDGKPVSGSEVASMFAFGLNSHVLPPLDMIERVEVIRGPMSSLYGSSAVGGMVNLITKKVSNEWSGSLSGQYNFFQNKKNGNNWNTGAYLTGPLIKDVLGIKVNSLFSRKNMDTSNLKRNNGLKNINKNFGGKLNLAVTDRDAMSFEYQYFKDEIFYNPNENLFSREGTYKKNIFVLDHEGKYDKLTLQSYLKYDKSKYSGNRASNSNLLYGGSLSTLMFNTQGSYNFDKHVLTLGLNYINERLDDIEYGKTSRWNAAIFAEDDFFITDNFILTLGARLNRNERFGTHFSPRVYGVYHINDYFTIKGGVSTGYINPELLQSQEGRVEIMGPTLNVAVLGNSKLGPENSVNYELGFAYNDEKINFSLMGFYSDFKDKIDVEELCRNGVWNNTSTWTCSVQGNKYSLVRKNNNLDDLYSAGVELTLDYKVLSNLNFKSNYTYIRSKYKKGVKKGKLTKQFPEHVVNFRLDYRPVDKINLWTNISYKHKEKDEINWGMTFYGKPSHTSVDLGLSYKVSNNLNINAGTYNLFNSDPKVLSNWGDGAKYSILDGRKFMIGFNANF